MTRPNGSPWRIPWLDEDRREPPTTTVRSGIQPASPRRLHEGRREPPTTTPPKPRAWQSDLGRLDEDRRLPPDYGWIKEHRGGPESEGSMRIGGNLRLRHHRHAPRSGQASRLNEDRREPPITSCPRWQQNAKRPPRLDEDRSEPPTTTTCLTEPLLCPFRGLMRIGGIPPITTGRRRSRDHPARHGSIRVGGNLRLRPRPRWQRNAKCPPRLDKDRSETPTTTRRCATSCWANGWGLDEGRRMKLRLRHVGFRPQPRLSVNEDRNETPITTNPAFRLRQRQPVGSMRIGVNLRLRHGGREPSLEFAGGSTRIGGNLRLRLGGAEMVRRVSPAQRGSEGTPPITTRQLA